MAEYTSNAQANVSAGKGVRGGYCYRAPRGTDLPTSPSWTPAPVYALTEDTEVDPSKTYYTRSGAGTDQSPHIFTEVESPAKASLSTYYEKSEPWKCMGFITEDGVAFQTETDSEDFTDMNGDLMDTSQSTYGESFSCAFAETKKAVFESMYGEDAVTDTGGVLTVNHTGEEPTAYSYVFLFILKNGRKWVRFAENCKRTEMDDTTAAASEVLAWQATFKALKSDVTGGYFKDLFESTETAAG